MKPRRLEYLRIDDDPPEEWADDAKYNLPVNVVDLQFWFEFCKDLSDQKLWKFELLTIDFNFDKDNSGPWYPSPGKDKSENSFAGDPVLSKLEWPNTLVARVLGPNSGILIGSYLVAHSSYRDLPCGVAIYSRYKDIVSYDMPSAMLVTQVLLASNAMKRTGDLGETMRTALAMVSLAQTKRLRGIGDAVSRFRNAFLHRADAIPSEENPVRLWSEPVSLCDLLNVFRSAQTEEELDTKLESFGIDFHDRNGVLDSLDIRSVFLDQLIVVDEEENDFSLLTRLPLSVVKPSAGSNSPAGVIWQFVEALAINAPANVAPVMQFFHRMKACKESGNINQIKRKTHKLIALIFAWIDLYAEYWFKTENASYDAAEDDFDRLDFSPLALQVKELLRIIALATDEEWVVKGKPFDPRIHPLPVVGTRSVSSLLRKYCDRDSVLYASLRYDLPDTPEGKKSSTALKHLLETAERWGCIVIKEDRSGKEYVLLTWMEIPQRRPVKFEQTQIASRLGFNVEGGKDPSNQLNRIVREAPGYETQSIRDFLLGLEERPLPDHFKRLGWEFVDEFWRQGRNRLPREALPLCLSDMNTSAEATITYAQWAVEMERSLADVLRVTADIVPPEFSLSVAGCEIYGKRKFADQLGGDYYHVNAEPGNIIRLCIGDVVGKGAGATNIVHEIHALVSEYEARGLTADDICTALDQRLIERPSDHGVIYAARDYPGNRWATFVYSTLDLESRRMSYVNAGHPAPFLVRANGDVLTLESHESQSIPLGIPFESTYRAETVELNSGDRIVFYTDGLSDGPDEGMIRSVLEYRSLDAKALAEELLRAGQTSAPVDDLTIIVATIL